MGALLSLLANPVVLVVMLATACVGGAYRMGGLRAEVRMAEQREKEQREAYLRARERSAANAALVADQRKAHQVDIEDYEERIRKLKGRVNQYVPDQANRGCIVTRGFVQLHDDAASGRVSGLPAGAGGSVTDPAGVSLADVGDAVTDNYGACGKLRKEVVLWRQWYASQSARWTADAGAADAKPAQLPQPKGSR